MASKKKHYAVKSGRDPLTEAAVHDVILDSWAEAYPLVHGAPGAVYAGFATMAEAEAWLADRQDDSGSGTGAPIPSKKATKFESGPARKTGSATTASLMASKTTHRDEVPDFPADTLCCYVDGSFNDSIPNYGYGIICLFNGEIVHASGGTGKNAKAISMRQIAGELLGAMRALAFARRRGYAGVVILHDYKGVSMHAEGTWKRTNPFSTTYYEWMQAFFRDNPGISVQFRKVDAHAGNRFNELADVLAKTAVGMTPDPAYLKMARDLGLFSKANADAPVDANADAPVKANADAPVDANADAPVDANADAPVNADAPASDWGLKGLRIPAGWRT